MEFIVIKRMDRDLFEIVRYCDERLSIAHIEDYEGAFNGLQFQNSGVIHKIAAAVDGNLESIERAAEVGADLLFVHHGIFWGHHTPIIKNTYKKYKALIGNDIALYSCHLPLDAHLEIGNNAIIAQKLGLTHIFSEFEFHRTKIGIIGKKKIERQAFKEFLKTIFQNFIAMEYGPRNIENIAVVSGGSGKILDQLAQNNEFHIDTVLIGECQQYHYNIARENNINVYLCGHYATEIFGVNALATEVSQKFSLPFEFIHSECPL
ncbi:MAG: Nif3-like dinuclear metal center hexameric protein [Puniceicoccales bacterium]|jgi:dinuclear metal center YbgI/SA1388 family protein|nr:Nif3-like dinuclear metal center hexameric protein [Puniceicoccales bacterium]